MKIKKLLSSFILILCVCITLVGCSCDRQQNDDGGADGEPSETATYTVSFDCDRLITINNQTVRSGEKAQEPLFTIDGIEIEGWEVDGVAFDFNTPITKDTVIKLKYSRYFTVRFDCSKSS